MVPTLLKFVAEHSIVGTPSFRMAPISLPSFDAVSESSSPSARLQRDELNNPSCRRPGPRCQPLPRCFQTSRTGRVGLLAARRKVPAWWRRAGRKSRVAADARGIVNAAFSHNQVIASCLRDFSARHCMSSLVPNQQPVGQDLGKAGSITC